MTIFGSVQRISKDFLEGGKYLCLSFPGKKRTCDIIGGLQRRRSTSVQFEEMGSVASSCGMKDGHASEFGCFSTKRK